MLSNSILPHCLNNNPQSIEEVAVWYYNTCIDQPLLLLETVTARAMPGRRSVSLQCNGLPALTEILMAWDTDAEGKEARETLSVSRELRYYKSTGTTDNVLLGMGRESVFPFRLLNASPCIVAD
jgi:hypothetical protein